MSIPPTPFLDSPTWLNRLSCISSRFVLWLTKLKFKTLRRSTTLAPKSVTGLKRLYRGNSTARMLLDYFASRERNRESTNFNRLLTVMSGQDEPPTRARIREVLRSLEKLGFGTFVIGRRGHVTRFEWSMPLTEVGMTAQIPVKLTKTQTRRAAKPVAAVKRGPGRPRKVVEEVVKRGPGRPRKIAA